MRDKETHEVKLKQLNSPKEQKLYDEVADETQPTISVKWVLKPKTIDGQHNTEARPCVSGFQELQNF